MTDAPFHTAPPPGSDGWRATGERLGAYLKSRPTEVWMFFAAGLVLGAILA